MDLDKFLARIIATSEHEDNIIKLCVNNKNGINANEENIARNIYLHDS